MWYGELFHRAVRMVDAEDLLTHRRKVHSHGYRGYAQATQWHLEPYQAVIVGRAIGEALPDGLLKLKKWTAITARSRVVAIGGVAEDYGSAPRVLDRVLHAVPGGNNCVGTHQGHTAGGEKKTQCVAEVHIQNHSHGRRHDIADVTSRRDTSSILPVRRIVAEPERCVVRFRIGCVP